MGKLDGKVALITGAARGQGRAHAARLASEGADIIAVDIAAAVPTVPYTPATEADLQETIEVVEKNGRRIFSSVVDVRDYASLESAVSAGVAELGRLDIVVANAGIMTEPTPLWLQTAEQWNNTVDINLTGVFHTLKATVPTLLAQGQGGSIIIVASVAGVKGYPGMAGYVAAKHGAIGLMKSLAQEIGPLGIRVNAVLPCSVDTDMIRYDDFYKMMRPDLESPTQADAGVTMATMQLLPVPWVEVEDVANAVSFLAGDEARNVHGLELRVDGGFMQK